MSANVLIRIWRAVAATFTTGGLADQATPSLLASRQRAGLDGVRAEPQRIVQPDVVTDHAAAAQDL